MPPKRLHESPPVFVILENCHRTRLLPGQTLIKPPTDSESSQTRPCSRAASRFETASRSREITSARLDVELPDARSDASRAAISSSNSCTFQLNNCLL